MKICGINLHNSCHLVYLYVWFCTEGSQQPIHLGLESNVNTTADSPALTSVAQPSGVLSMPSGAVFHTSPAQLGVVSCHTFSVPPHDTSPQGQVSVVSTSQNLLAFDLDSDPAGDSSLVESLIRSTLEQNCHRVSIVSLR